MGRAKEIVMKVIPAKVATPFMKAHHYSGKVVNNSTLHFGVFLDGQLHGVMSYGPSLDKSKIIGLVKDTGWNEFLELNRMAFDSYLPRNSESRANAIWNFDPIDGYVEIDSEQMNFYKGAELKNDTVTGSGFPALYPGKNTISFSGGITKVSVIPRWVTL